MLIKNINFIFLALIFVLLVIEFSAYAREKHGRATFAGGCFWCMEHPFEKLEGVLDVVPGYTGGHKENPTYSEVSAGETGHVEAVQIIFDPSKITYQELLDVFWKQIDPTDPDGQFVDRGRQYVTAVFYNNEKQKALAEKSKTELNKSGRFKKPVVTKILKASKFYAAEDYHNDYYKKNPIRYKFYRHQSGRDQYLKKIWTQKMGNTYPEINRRTHVKWTKKELREKLTPLQYKITQENGTEAPFDNQYWNNKEEGIYVDVVSGEPLFVSTDKYDSGTGWPSFTKPLESKNILEVKDRRLFQVRIEVRSKHTDSHLLKMRLLQVLTAMT